MIPPAPAFDLHARLKPIPGRRLMADSATKGESLSPIHLGLQINGPGGGEWELTFEQGKLVSSRPGLSARCTATYYLNTTTFAQLAESRTNAGQAIGTGRVVIEGNGVPLDDLADTLQNLAIAAGKSPNLSSAE